MELTTILTAACILGGVGLIFGTFIALAHRRFEVWEDPRIDSVTDLLPGTNCGACGFPGCHAFAEGLVGGEAQPAGCTVMGSDDAAEVAHFLGVEVGEAAKRVARLLCAGGCDVAVQQAEYRGLGSCVAAAAIAAGGKGCTWGCLGLGDCEDVCDLDAITMGEKLLVQCRSALEGDEAEALCQVACTACGKCVMDAPEGAIEIIDGLAVVHRKESDQAGPEATNRCPTGAIVWMEGAQFANAPWTGKRVGV